MMKQVVCVGANDDVTRSVEVIDVPEPACPAGGVIVTVRARPINPADLLLLAGRHVYRPAYPVPVGIEGAGVVSEVGADSRLRVGDVVAIPAGSTVRDADRIIVIEGARIVEQGAHDELMARRGTYRRLVEHQLISDRVAS